MVRRGRFVSCFVSVRGGFGFIFLIRSSVFYGFFSVLFRCRLWCRIFFCSVLFCFDSFVVVDVFGVGRVVGFALLL